MKVLIVGGGGREHALAWRVANNPNGHTHEIFCAPGNAGTAAIARNIPIDPRDINALCDFAKDNGIDYTIIGLDDSLALGVVDLFKSAGLRVFGPVKAAARLEWSKGYAKGFMRKYGIPTAASHIFNDYASALRHARTMPLPAVVKADGLAAGKGAYVCKTYAELETALAEVMQSKKFGAAGDTAVIEEFLAGHETTVMAFCDGKRIVPMVSAMDYKRAYDGGKGPNTGGMGAISPSPYFTEDAEERFRREIMLPTLNGLLAEGICYQGFLYFELMLTEAGPYVLEYNARFGDPEAQAVLPRLRSDLLEICMACDDGLLDKTDIAWDNKGSVCVILASGGYPNSYEVGLPISGLEGLPDGAHVFHAGTKTDANGQILTAGGRVLGITCLGANTREAALNAYAAAERVVFKDMRYRRDIG